MDSLDRSLSGHNLAFVEDLWARFLEDPTSVPEDWRRAFEAHRTNGGSGTVPRGVSGPSFRPRSIFAAAGAPSAAAVLPMREADLPDVPAERLAARLRLLDDVRLFHGVPRAEVTLAARLATDQTLADGEHLFRVGDEGNTLYLVADGHLEVRRKDELIGTKNRGDVIGEMSVLNAQPRWADVVAHGPATVLRLDGQDLAFLIEHRPALARSMVAMLSTRLRQRSHRQDQVSRLVHAFRVRGHLLASLDPLESPRDLFPELDPAHYGLEDHMDSLFASPLAGRASALPLKEILDVLRSVYCGSIGVQFMHIDDQLAARSG